jgi:hypothetical protein
MARGTMEWSPMTSARAGKTLVLLGLLGLWLARDADGFLPVLDDANLAFHEAGHVLLGLLGPVARLYGGTVGQLFFPVAVVLSFWVRRHPAGFVLGGAWLCQNLLHLARDVADAGARALPRRGDHGNDWTVLLERWGGLASDARLAGLLRGVALLGLLLLGLWTLWRWGLDRAASRRPARSLPVARLR